MVKRSATDDQVNCCFVNIEVNVVTSGLLGAAPLQLAQTSGSECTAVYLPVLSNKVVVNKGDELIVLHTPKAKAKATVSQARNWRTVAKGKAKAKAQKIA